MNIQMLQGSASQGGPSVIELLAAKRTQIWRENEQLDNAGIALDGDDTKASAIAIDIKRRMDAILDEDKLICRLLSYEQPRSAHEIHILLSVLNFIDGDFEETEESERIDARDRVIGSILSALPAQTEADPCAFGIVVNPDTATLLAEAAKLTGQGIEPIGPAAHEGEMAIAA